MKEYLTVGKVARQAGVNLQTVLLRETVAVASPALRLRLPFIRAGDRAGHPLR